MITNAQTVYGNSVLKRLVPVGRSSSHNDGFHGLGHRHLTAFPGQVLDTGGDGQSAATMLFRVGHRSGVRAVCDLLKNRMDTHTYKAGYSHGSPSFPTVMIKLQGVTRLSVIIIITIKIINIIIIR